MRHFIIGFFLTAFAFFSCSALAQERITNFDITLDAQKDGSLVITETIDVISEGAQIKRGIFRELPRYYTFRGVKQENNYKIISIRRDGQREDFNVSVGGNGVTWRIGDANVFLNNGPHRYEIKYEIDEWVLRHRDDGLGADRDEVYWNATGTYWEFPIERATVTVNLPNGANIIDSQAYTGGFRSQGQDYTKTVEDNSIRFATTQPLNRKEGISVSVAVAPGVFNPISQARLNELNWIRTGGPIMLGLGGLGLLGYYLMMWFRVGRDPMKPAVFPRYAPPKDYSAAAVHHIHHKGFRKMDALTATLMSLAMKDVVDIRADKKKTTITSMLDNRSRANLLPDERKLLDQFFGDRDGKIVMDKKTDAGFYKDVRRFMQYISKNYGRKYHRSNAVWGLVGMAASLAIVIFIMNQPVSKSGLPFLIILLAIAAMNLLFFWLLRAPTKRGAQISSEIDGFKLYLETAEKDRINTANPLGEQPPAMTVDLYERFMPYALALGVEKPWTKQFETTMPREAKDYQPSYAHGDAINMRGGSPFKMSDALATAMTAGVAAAAPVSQSSGSSGGFSSGSSGGGFSGGGGGGGGGGGW